MVYDIFDQQVADYLGSSGATLERENIYRGGQLLATDDSPIVAAPSALSGSLSGSNIALSWTAVSGASYYRVERNAGGCSFTLRLCRIQGGSAGARHGRTSKSLASTLGSG